MKQFEQYFIGTANKREWLSWNPKQDFGPAADRNLYSGRVAELIVQPCPKGLCKWGQWLEILVVYSALHS